MLEKILQLHQNFGLIMFHVSDMSSCQITEQTTLDIYVNLSHAMYEQFLLKSSNKKGSRSR